MYLILKLGQEVCIMYEVTHTSTLILCDITVSLVDTITQHNVTTCATVLRTDSAGRPRCPEQVEVLNFTKI